MSSLLLVAAGLLVGVWHVRKCCEYIFECDEANTIKYALSKYLIESLSKKIDLCHALLIQTRYILVLSPIEKQHYVTFNSLPGV